jgi:hypothetical protein
MEAHGVFDRGKTCDADIFKDVWFVHMDQVEKEFTGCSSDSLIESVRKRR